MHNNNIHSTHTLCKQKALFWIWFITSNHVTALVYIHYDVFVCAVPNRRALNRGYGISLRLVTEDEDHVGKLKLKAELAGVQDKSWAWHCFNELDFKDNRLSTLPCVGTATRPVIHTNIKKLSRVAEYALWVAVQLMNSFNSLSHFN